MLRDRHSFASYFKRILTGGTIGLVACAATVGRSDENSWPVDRGSASSQGVSESKMPDKPVELWKYEVPEGAFDAPAIIANDQVFLCDADGTVHCLLLKDGSQVWKVKLDTNFLAAAAFQRDRLIVGDMDGFVTCLNAKDGNEIWKFETGAQIDSGPNFYKELVLVTSEDGLLYALNFDDGKLAWKYETGDQLRCAPTIAGNLTFLGGCDGVLHVVDLDKGESIGKVMSLESPTGSTPGVLGDLAIVPTHAGTVLAFDWRQAKELWRFTDTKLTQEIRTSPAIFGDLVFVTPRNKRVLALSKDKGTIAWEHVLRKRSDSSPVFADGRVWITTTDGLILALDEKTGEERWSDQRTGAFLAAPAIAQQKIVVANDKGVVYCFGAANL